MALLPKKLRTYLELVRFEHTLFALPFAYGGMLLGARGLPSAGVFFWITLAMVGARTASMALNRLIDWKIDAINPRTASRHLPRGVVKPVEVAALSGIGFVCLVLAALNLNALTIKLLPVAVFFMVTYSYTKRFTWLCHYWMGLTIGAASAAGWIAVTGRFEPATFALWAATLFWLAGFDILYATQDFQFDRTNGVLSIPARFGIAAALRVARANHLLSWTGLLLTGVLYAAGLWYFAGVFLVGLVLLYEHSLVKEDDLSKVDAAFFQANVAVSVGMFLFILTDQIVA